MKNKLPLLYVDDESINLQLFKINFSEKYQVFTATSGKEGLKTLAENTSIRTVVTDLRMPGMDGLQFATKAKKDFPEVNFFILTAFELNESIKEAIASGLVYKYLKKPLDLDRMNANIQELVQA